MTQNVIPNLRLEQTLKAEENAAVKAPQFAQDELSRVCSTQIDGWPKKVEEARIKLDITRHALVIALIRINDFMRHGTVPGDLKNLNVQAERTKGRFSRNTNLQ